VDHPGPQLHLQARFLACAECGRSPRPGEMWRILFSDIGEVAVYCPECAAAGSLAAALGRDLRSEVSEVCGAPSPPRLVRLGDVTGDARQDAPRRRNAIRR
jgi:hypothetical protein